MIQHLNQNEPHIQMNFTAILTFLLSLRVDDYLKSKTVGESTCVFLNLLKKTKSEHQQKLHMRNASKCREGEERPGGGLAGASIKGCQGERLGVGGKREAPSALASLGDSLGFRGLEALGSLPL